MKSEKNPRISLKILLTVAWILFSVAPVLFSCWARAGENFSVRSFASHSRLTINLDSSVKTEWKDVPGGFELFLKGLTLADLGAPLGGEAAWMREEGAKVDTRLEKMTFRETADGVLITARWRFPEGSAALVNPIMDKFQYREKDGTRLVVDFWAKPGPTIVQVKKKLAKKKINDDVLHQRERERKRQESRLAQIRARALLDDVSSFCGQPLSESTDVFLTLKPVHDPFDLTKYFSMTLPDRDYTYHRPTVPGKEADYFRLALDLVAQDKPALVIKAIEFFEHDFPKSEYRHELRFLKANTLIRLGLTEQANTILEGLIASAPDSPVALQAGMFSAMRSISQGKSLAALESFLWLTHRYPEHQLAWVFHMGAAEAMFQLEQTERGVKEYEWVMEHGPDRYAQSEAASRIGDFFMDRAQYEQALASYFQASTRFPAEMERKQSLHINRGEALYWLSQYDRARPEFESYLSKFPSEASGWRAAYRLGEIVGREKTAEAQAQSRKWFYDVVNRFPFTPGATLARLRLVPCADHGGFEPGGVEKFFDSEVRGFTGSNEVVMDRYRDYRALAEVRAMVAIGNTRGAVDVAIRELQSGVRFEARPAMSDLLRLVFRKHLIAELSSGHDFDAVKFYLDHADSVPQYSEGGVKIDPDYLLALSRAASSLKMGQVAERIASAYDRAARLEGRAIASNPDAQLERALKESDRSFTEARAIFTSEGIKSEPKIRELLSQVVDESEHSGEREVLLSLLDQKTKKPASALQHAIRAQVLLGNDGKAGPRLAALTMSLQAEAGDKKTAILLARELLKKDSDAADPIGQSLGIAPVPPREELLLNLGEWLGELGHWGEAAQTFESAMSDGLGGNHALYEYSRALSKTGDQEDRGKSMAAMKKLAESDVDDFWSDLARQAIGAPPVKKIVKPKQQPTAAKEGTK